MTPDLGKYADAVLSAYGVSLLLLVVLIVWTLRQGGRARRALQETEKRSKRDA